MAHSSINPRVSPTRKLPASSASGVASATPSKLRDLDTPLRKAMDPADQRKVNKAMEILASYMKRPTLTFSTPHEVRNYCCLRLGALPHEVFGVMFLDANHRLIAFEEMFRGSLTQCAAYPREVVIQALLRGAASVVLTHNHPSGALKPSKADIELTGAINNALALVDVRVLDHVIVGHAESLSMCEMGYWPLYVAQCEPALAQVRKTRKAKPPAEAHH